ncbi:MAG: thiamine pyrophosphate-binding protein, partial [Pseudomonas sp.]
LRTAGALLSGSPYRLMAEVVVPADTTPASELWLTVEGWDGSVHQTAIPLSQASPSLITWLERQPGARP